MVRFFDFVNSVELKQFGKKISSIILYIKCIFGKTTMKFDQFVFISGMLDNFNGKQLSQTPYQNTGSKWLDITFHLLDELSLIW